RKLGTQGTGVIEPIKARLPVGALAEDGTLIDPDNVKFLITAGETRWWAAQEARLPVVPVIIEDLREEDAYELAYWENHKRRSLSRLDDARAMRTIINQRGLSRRQAAV